jgi:putative membrane protein
MIYLWVKTLHILAIISWMAGLLYLPRLYVYHADVEHGSAPATLFETMEWRLYRYIMTPAMIVAWLTGLHMAATQGYWMDVWFLSKLALVVAMSGVHGFLGGLRRRLAAGTNQKSSRYFRVLNEVPTLLMIFIVGLVILKPYA